MSNDDQEKTPKEEIKKEEIKADFRKVSGDFKSLFSKTVQKLGPIAKKILSLMKKLGSLIITLTKKGFHFLINVLKNLKKKKASANPTSPNQTPNNVTPIVPPTTPDSTPASPKDSDNTPKP